MDETEKGKAASEKAPKSRRTAWWVEILIAVAVVLVVVGIAIPAYNAHKTNARREEAKSNLLDIQLAVEYYGVDAGGAYPEFLIGGSAPKSDDAKNPYAQAADPLLRKGYLTAYPRNPFAVPQDVMTMQEKYRDTFRPGTGESKFGMRFGEDYTLMGQVLADFRFPKLAGQKMTQANGVYYYADTEYPFWDIWPKGARKPKPFLPGEFFYKSVRSYITKEIESLYPDKPVGSTIADMYIIGLYGAPADRGKNVLGPEQSVSYKSEYGSLKLMVPDWTRSTLTPNERGEFLGDPFSIPPEEHSDLGFEEKGVRDAVILVIRSGQDSRIKEDLSR